MERNTKNEYNAQLTCFVAFHSIPTTSFCFPFCFSPFQDRFGHSSPDEPPHFPLNRVQQIDSVARELVKAYSVPSHHRQSAWSSPSSQAGSSSSSLGLAFSLAGGGVADKAITRRPPGWVNRLITNDFVYNPWANLIQGTPAHQLDRLHGGDLATPATILWADMLLWHLKQGVSP